MLEAIICLTALGGGLGIFLGIAAKKLHVETNPINKEIEDILPGSNCGQCGFPGCSAAAAAVANGKASVTLCPPGGKAVAQALAEKMNVSVDLTTITDVGPTIAVVDENVCTGCARCSRKCPTDAIIGASKQIHTVVQDACTGCGICVETCPVDCITLKPVPVTLQSWYWPKPSAEKLHSPVEHGGMKQ